MLPSFHSSPIRPQPCLCSLCSGQRMMSAEWTGTRSWQGWSAPLQLQLTLGWFSKISWTAAVLLAGTWYR